MRSTRFHIRATCTIHINARQLNDNSDMVSSPGYVPLVQNEEKSNYTDHRQGHTLQEKNITKTKIERNGKKVNKVKLLIIKYVINVSPKLYVLKENFGARYPRISNFLKS